MPYRPPKKDKWADPFTANPAKVNAATAQRTSDRQAWKRSRCLADSHPGNAHAVIERTEHL